MNTRFVTWTIGAMCLTGAAGCGSESPSIPSAPTPTSPRPAPTPPPPRSLAVDLTGNYALTFEVGNACEQVPKELRIRTYEARIEYESSQGSTDTFLAVLSGAMFHSYHPVLIDVTGNSALMELSDNMILEGTVTEPVRRDCRLWCGFCATDRAVNDFGFVHRLLQVLRRNTEPVLGRCDGTQHVQIGK